MAVRVTDADVKVLMPEVTFDTATYIATANRYVNATLLSADLTADQLVDIELWLSAHLVAQTDEEGGIVSRRTGDSSVTYNNLQAESLATTRFGQQAIGLDTSGTLNASKKGKATFKVL